jgi:16S rRNA (guanine966-N2)-methyltransferase
MTIPGNGRNRLRIIGGEHRGRQIVFPDQAGLRPTADRLRETLFNWLQAVIPGARCLDLFAGSGALGFEAASRGARRVVMVEVSAPAARRLEENAVQLGLEGRVAVVRDDALTWLTGPAERFDVVFVDPPFAADLVAPVIDRLALGGWLAAQSWVYIEQDVRQPLAALRAGWQVWRDKRAGQVAYRLVRVQEDSYSQAR